MPFMDELKRLVRPYSDDDDDYDEEDMEEEEEVEEEPVKPAPRAARPAPVKATPAPNYTAAPSPAPVSPMNSLRASNNLQMVLVKPERYDEVSSIADHLRDKSAVVLNLEACDRASAKRIVDFLSGCAYALEGNIKKVATCTYVITPFNVDVVGELAAEAEAASITYGEQ